MRLGHIDEEPTWPTLPAHLAGLRILDVPADNTGAAMGLVKAIILAGLGGILGAAIGVARRPVRAAPG